MPVTTAPLVRMTGLCKHYDGVAALVDAHLDIQPGEVVALAGENGAGKSTLVKILSGLVAPDSGQITFAGETVSIHSPSEARDLGIAVVHQDFDLAPNLSVAENLVVGNEPHWRGGFIDRRRQRETAQHLLALVGADVDPGTPASSLGVAQRQLVAIARALARPVRLLILDEPTSALAADDIEHLLKLVERQKAAGTAVLFISHKLGEVFRVADRISVFRDGRSAGILRAAQTTPSEVVSLMVGRERAEALIGETVGRNLARAVEPLMEVRGLRTRDLSGSVDFHIKPGEILGVYGLKGAGRTTVLRALFGLDLRTAGEIRLDGKPVDIRSPRQAMACGIGWVCRDRKERGLFDNLNLRENLSLAALDSLARLGFINRRAERGAVLEFIEQLNIKTTGPDQAIHALSGGNQQKVLLARWLLRKPRVLILDEPTVGIDIGAKAEIHTLIRNLAVSGLGILLVSSELPEMLALSDRVLVMHAGRIITEFAAEEASQEKVMQAIHA